MKRLWWACGGHSSSRCTGLSLSRPLLLRSTGSRRTGSVTVAHGPSCSAACGILPDQGSNPRPPHWQADSQPLRHQGSPSLYFFINSARFGFSLFFFSPQFLRMEVIDPRACYCWIVYSFFFLAALGLCCCTQAFSSCGEWGLLFVAVRGLLTAVASLVAEHRL